MPIGPVTAATDLNSQVESLVASNLLPPVTDQNLLVSAPLASSSSKRKRPLAPRGKAKRPKLQITDSSAMLACTAAC